MKIRNVLPINFYYKLRFLKDFIFQKNMPLKLSQNSKIWFLDSPSYENLGDQAIAYATTKFLKDTLSNYEIIEVTENNLIKYLSFLKDKIKKDDLIVLQGGGNLGDLYPRYEFLRRQVIKNFPNNKIIIFPQSVWFSNTNKGYKEQNISSKIYGKHRYLTICARDSKSYNLMKKIFPKNKTLLCPDMALYLTNLIQRETREGIGICLRDDLEKISFNEKEKQFIQQIYEQYKKVCKITTFSCINMDITSNLRKNLVLDNLKEFSKYDVIITDRLHCVIFSYITNTPCMFFTSKTKKIENLYYDWLKNCSFIHPYKNNMKIDVLYNDEKASPLDFSNLINVLQNSKESKK